MREAEMDRIAALMTTVLESPDDEGVAERIRGEVKELTSRFPLYPNV
jgi:glycine/serine hydroxymethyltransferase